MGARYGGKESVILNLLSRREVEIHTTDLCTINWIAKWEASCRYLIHCQHKVALSLEHNSMHLALNCHLFLFTVQVW